MLFSTYPPEALPKAGDTVCLNYGEPLLVVRRARDKYGQVLLRLQSPDGSEILEMVEACHWWPTVGDLCTGVPATYQRWLTCHWEDAKAADDKPTLKRIEKAFYAYNNPSSWLYGEFTIQSIKGEVATVTGVRFSGTHALPLSACAVLSRPSVQRVLELAA